MNTESISFSLEGTSMAKIDFVTQVLRDIAAGLGFGTSFVPFNNQLQLYGAAAYTGLENLVVNAINTNDGYLAYQRATQGTLAITIPSYGTLYLYAPTTWQQGLSLNTFIPSEQSGISRLLTYQYGKGTVIRDITDDYYNLFYNGFGWQYSITTCGTPNSIMYQFGNNETPTAYHGVISENSYDFTSNTSTQQEMEDPQLEKGLQESVNNNYEDETFDILTYCKPYDPTINMNGIINHEGWTFSLLKKDGTWDVINEAGSGVTYYVLNLANITLHYPEEEYARTVDNYLRGRLTYNLRRYDSLYSRYYNQCKSKYYALDFVPQKVEMNVAKEYDDSHLQDEYLRDIDIAMRNLEGATSVYVEQLEEGDVLPVITNFTDFRSARYLATVDKEYGSEFTVVAYNQNGHRRSESLSVPAIQPASINMRNLGTYLNVTYGHKNKIVKNMTYIIQNIPSLSLSTGPVVKGTSSNGQINIQGLLNGLNLIKIQLPNGRTSSIIIKK